MISDENKQKALEILPEILGDMNSQLTVDENDNPFLIVEGWDELSKIQQELNKNLAPEAYYEHVIEYYNKRGNRAFREMRLDTNGHAPYLVPDGLFELDDVIEYEFSDEYTTCWNCGDAIRETPCCYGDMLRFGIVEGDMLCGDCINKDFEQEYIDSVTNNCKHALKTSIISEDRLAELGWTKRPEKYENGFREGQNDQPCPILKKLRETNDVLFTYQPSQFEIEFWAWTKPKEEEE
jgi:uncharacterized CHY-type Zn-finger protein